MGTTDFASVRNSMESLVATTQDQICAAIENLDGGKFHEDKWQRKEGGGGRSRVLQGGRVFEKAGINVSTVSGRLDHAALKALDAGTVGQRDLFNQFANGELVPFYATGISLVIHPHNPFAPTAHANYRYFQLGALEQPKAWWFGGGADLTPVYLFDEDAKHFHQIHKTACDLHNENYYLQFKLWCDQYFRITHRDEGRGIGGIFFDDLQYGDPTKTMAFVKDCASAFVPAYVPIVERRMKTDFSETHKRWQQLRRGRYVEFNLVYDRGTMFGLRSGGRIESILMSLPLTARWEYDMQPEPGSEEARLVAVLREPKTWV